MNCLRSLLSLVVILSLVAFTCNKDADDDCTTESWYGTYSVTSASCDDVDADDIAFVEQSASLTIEAGNEEGEIALTIEGELEPTYFLVTGCSLPTTSFEVDFFGVTIETSYGGSFDGTDITFEQTVTADDGDETTTVSCEFTMSKQ